MTLGAYFATAIVAALISLYIKQTKPDFAMLITLAGVVLVFSGIVPKIALIVSDIKAFTTEAAFPEEYITTVLKIIGISYVAQFASDICKDAGEQSLSAHVETLGKVSIMFIALPVVEDVFGLIINLLE